MNWIAFVLLGCGSSGDFQVSSPPDARMSLDLATTMDGSAIDMKCFNMACGGCSTLANFDNAAAKVGDPCLWKGTYQCQGNELRCSDNSCPTQCTPLVNGSICGADGHTIVEFVHPGGTCSVYDFGSAINVCNRSAIDRCVDRCSQNQDGSFQCAGHCISDDGGGTGCEYKPTDTCVTLKSC